VSLVGNTSSAASVASSANTVRVDAGVGLVGHVGVVRTGRIAAVGGVRTSQAGASGAVCGVRASEARASGAVSTVGTCGASVLASTDTTSTSSVTCGTETVRVNAGISLVGSVRAVRTSGVVWRSQYWKKG
jgi:hypothetical protein